MTFAKIESSYTHTRSLLLLPKSSCQSIIGSALNLLLKFWSDLFPTTKQAARSDSAQNASQPAPLPSLFLFHFRSPEFRQKCLVLLSFHHQSSFCLCSGSWTGGRVGGLCFAPARIALSGLCGENGPDKGCGVTAVIESLLLIYFSAKLKENANQIISSF